MRLKRKISFVLVLGVLIMSLLPLSSAFAYTGGLLNGKLINQGSGIDNSLGTISVWTDGSEAASTSLFAAGGGRDSAWYKFDVPMQITHFQLKASTATNLNMNFYDSNKNLIVSMGGGSGLVISGVKTAKSVSNVSYVEMRNYGATLNIQLFEFDVFGYSGNDVLAGKSVNLGRDENSITNTSLKITDGSTATSDAMSGNGSTTGVLWYKFTTPVSLNAISYQISTNGMVMYLYDNNGVELSNLAIVNSASSMNTISFNAVDNVSKVVFRQTTVQSSTVYEVKLFSGMPVDNTPPPVPENLKVSNVVSGSVKLDWDMNSTSVPDFAGWNVYKNGVKVNGSLLVSNTYTVTGLSDNVSYSFFVKSVDTTGNESAASNSVFTMNDTISPLAPIGLAVNGKTSDSSGSSPNALLTWSPNSESDLAGYNVYANLAKKNGSLITDTSYTVSNLAANVVYSFQITAVDTSNNESPKSQAVIYTYDTKPPAVPSGLIVNSGNGKASLSWTSNTTDSDIKQYNIYKDGAYFNSVQHPAAAFEVNGLNNGTSYSFQVSATDYNGNESAKSAAVKATPQIPADTTPPDKPTGLKATAGDGKVSLSWSPNTESDLSSYKVYRNASYVGSVIAPAHAYTASYLNNGEIYSFEVSAVDTSGNESFRSAIVTAKPIAVPLPGTGIELNHKDTKFTAADIFMNSVWVFSTIALFVLLSIALERVPKIIDLVVKSLK